MRGAPRRLLLAAPFALLLLLVTSCGAIGSPQGWAAPVVTAQGILSSVHHGFLTLTNPTTKQAIWQFPPAQNKNKIDLKGIYSTPVVTPDDQSVIFGAYNGHVYKLRLADGSQLWDVDTGAAIVGGVALAGDAAIVGNSDGTIEALAIDSGKQIWRQKARDRVWSTPVVDGETVYVASMDKRLYAFKATDGTQLWVNDSSAGALAATPTVAGDRLYEGSFDKHVYAIDKANGTLVWRSPKLANWVWAQAVMGDGRLYTGTLDGSVYALDANDGHIVWQKKIASSPVRARPALAQGVLVVADRAGRLEGYDPATGAPVWQQPVELNSTVLADLVVQQDGSVLIVTEGGSGGSRIVQIDPKTGATSVVGTS